MKKIAVALGTLLTVAGVWSALNGRHKPVPLKVKADKVVVWKKKREMQLLRQSQII